MEGLQEQKQPGEVCERRRNVYRRQDKPRGCRPATDARDGDSHPRTAAASAAFPKLDRRTFLGDRTPPHFGGELCDGQIVTIKIHDYGKQWMECSWGKADPRPGKRGCKGRSPNKEQNEKRARARAKGEIRRKCLAINADHMVTLTYRENIENREQVLRDLDRLRRMLARCGYPMPYVAVLECQQRGAIHLHLGVKGFQDVRFLRRCWYKIVGKGQGQVNVKGPRPGSSPVKLARYLAKYVSKDLTSLPRDFGEHRYFCSLSIVVPTEKYQLVLTRQAREVDARMNRLMLEEILRRIGEFCTVQHWAGGSGTYGWMSGYEDAACHWVRNKSSPLPATATG